MTTERMLCPAGGVLQLGPAEQIPCGEGRRVVVEDCRIAVFRQRDGSLFAVEDRCPHQGAPLSEGILGAGQVICPYHAYRFNLATGECLNDGACSVRTYPAWEEDGEIWLTVNEPGS